MPLYANTQSFVDLFRPPQGFHTDFVAMTTFTLSLRLLVRIPLLMDCGEKGILPPRQLGAALRREGYAACCDRFRVYYDGAAKAAVDDASFYGTAAGRLAQQLLATRCTPVHPTSGLFHPKILLFQFSDKNNQKFFRVHISSRNLTMGQMLEAGVTLETAATPEPGQTDPTARQLAEFFRLLPEAPDGPDLDALERTVLRLHDGGQGLEGTLYFSGLDKIGGSALQPTLLETMRGEAGTYPCLRVISMAPDTQLFTKEKFQKIRYVCNFRDLYQPGKKPGRWERKPGLWKRKKGASSFRNAFDAGVCVCEEKNGRADPTLPRNLHIKEYRFGRDNDSPGMVWIGSANCSRAALEGENVEVMVRYRVEKCPMPDFANAHFRSNPTLRFCIADRVDNPVLPDDPTDRFLQVRVVRAALTQPAPQTWTLEVTLHNQEEVPVTVWMPHLPEQPLAGKSCKLLRFDIPAPSRYSQVLLLQKEGEQTLYTLPLDLGWDQNAPRRDELIQRIPLDPMTSVKDLIPALPGENTSTDEAYERVLKWAVLRPDACEGVFAQVDRDCQDRCLELDSLTHGVPENRQALLDALQNGLREPDAGEDPDDWRCRQESAYTTALFLHQIRALQRLLEELSHTGKEESHE